MDNKQEIDEANQGKALDETFAKLMKASIARVALPQRLALRRTLPEFLDKFAERSGDYGDTYLFLGSKGQFSDISRKFWKLYRSIWLGATLTGEQEEEIVQDILAHCFLLLECMGREKGTLAIESGIPGDFENLDSLWEQEEQEAKKK